MTPRSASDRPYHRVVSLLPSPLAPTGGVFRLDRKLTTDISRPIAGGWSAFARSDGQDFIVSGPQGAADYETALEDAISTAQEALDLIAAEGGPATCACPMARELPVLPHLPNDRRSIRCVP
jgi:hypothetical protein